MGTMPERECNRRTKKWYRSLKAEVPATTSATANRSFLRSDHIPPSDRGMISLQRARPRTRPRRRRPHYNRHGPHLSNRPKGPAQDRVRTTSGSFKMECAGTRVPNDGLSRRGANPRYGPGPGRIRPTYPASTLHANAVGPAQWGGSGRGNLGRMVKPAYRLGSAHVRHRAKCTARATQRSSDRFRAPPADHAPCPFRKRTMNHIRACGNKGAGGNA